MTVNPWECPHESTELRQRVNRGGAVMFGHQCLHCGRVDGKWVKRADIQRPQDLPIWDRVLEERMVASWADAERARRAGEAYSRSTRWWQVYRQFLASPEWAEMRRRVLERAGHVCEACLLVRAAQVHHTAYPKRPPELEGTAWTPPTLDDFANQPLFELRAICHACHRLRHAHMREEAA